METPLSHFDVPSPILKRRKAALNIYFIGNTIAHLEVPLLSNSFFLQTSPPTFVVPFLQRRELFKTPIEGLSIIEKSYHISIHQHIIENLRYPEQDPNVDQSSFHQPKTSTFTLWVRAE
jgi:hypothetical protein